MLFPCTDHVVNQFNYINTSETALELRHVETSMTVPKTIGEHLSLCVRHIYISTHKLSEIARLFGDTLVCLVFQSCRIDSDDCMSVDWSHLAALRKLRTLRIDGVPDTDAIHFCNTMKRHCPAVTVELVKS